MWLVLSLGRLDYGEDPRLKSRRTRHCTFDFLLSTLPTSTWILYFPHLKSLSRAVTLHPRGQSCTYWTMGQATSEGELRPVEIWHVHLSRLLGVIQVFNTLHRPHQAAPLASHTSLVLTCSLANSIKKLGWEFEWIKSVEDFDKAEVSSPRSLRFSLLLETPLPWRRRLRTSDHLPPKVWLL